ncbi:MAG: hypothetical protein PHQ23_15705 [Candidatus Wallbacteria bacterium]|nr:hypothetical protein [Candidatus Wallbacteria bacterium]
MRSFLPLIFFLSLKCLLSAADITATLDSSDGSSAFTVKSSDSTPVGWIDSTGNAVIIGGLSIGSSASVTNGTIRWTGADFEGRKDGAWVSFTITDHGALTGLGDDDHNQYLLAAGTRSLSGDWNIGAGRMIQADKIRARDATGLALYDDGGTGIFVKDGGNIGIRTASPEAALDVNGHIHGAPVAGRWLATNHGVAGSVRYQWGTESFNTDNSYMSRTDSNYDITIYKAGYYLICVNALQSGLDVNERGDVALIVGGVTIVNSLGQGYAAGTFYKHSFSEIVYCNSNNTVRIYNTSATAVTYANDDAWSSLSIVRLN